MSTATPDDPEDAGPPRQQPDRAEERLRKAAQLERDRQRVWADVAADARRADENTARLKALRLEKQRIDDERRVAEAAAAKPVRTRRTTRKQP
mgnify:CR=1 FL=1